MARPDWPATIMEFQERFASEAACLDYLAASRWPEGFACPGCGGRRGWVLERRHLHDMSYPVEVLRTAGVLLSDGGRVLVADEKTAERVALDAGDVERLYYGFSVLHCLPVGLIGENAAGTGTVMREETVRGYAEQAGFVDYEVAPIENDFWRFYLLTP